MSICRGCGGILGRDCWNEADCIQISNQQAHDLYLLDFMQRDLNYAEERIRFLEEFIVNSGLEIPYPTRDLLTEDEEDWLPF